MVIINQGIKEIFSTGSQNHQPPHPNSLYAHQLPKAIPNDKKIQVRYINTFIFLLKFILNFKNHIFKKPIINIKAVPKYPQYSIGG